MASERSSDQSPVKPGRLSVADRMRSYRRRRRQGLRCVQVQVGPVELDGLVANGYLGSGDRDDIVAIQSAIEYILYERFSRA